MPTPKLQPGDPGYDWSTYSAAARDKPLTDAQEYLQNAPDYSGIASLEDRLAAMHRPEHGMARQITDFGEQIAGPAALASIVPTPISPFAGGAAATLYGLSGLRKALMPESDESRIGGAVEAGLSALPLAGRAFKALRGAKALAPEVKLAEEANPLAGMQAGEGSNANLIMDPGHTTAELTAELAAAKTPGEKDFLNRTLTQRQVVLRKLKEAATAPPPHYQSTEPLGPARYASKGQEVPYRMGSGNVDIAPRVKPSYPESLGTPKSSSSGYPKSPKGGSGAADTVGAKLTKRDYSQELRRATNAKPSPNATSVFDKMASEGTFGPSQQGFTNRQYNVDLSNEVNPLPEGFSYEDVFGPNPSDLELKKLARLSRR